jgi:hypothetical protein
LVVFAAGVVFADVSGEATSVSPPLQQALGPAFCGGGGCSAPATSVLDDGPALATDTETSTLAVDTEMSTFPAWTFTETPGMLTLTCTATVGTAGIAGGCGASSA